MNDLRILVANEPSAYRDVIAATFRALRPGVVVQEVAPGALDQAVLGQVPGLVVCSELSETVQTRAPAWVLLYPGGARRVVTSLAGRQTTAEDVALEDLLTLIDRLEPAR